MRFKLTVFKGQLYYIIYTLHDVMYVVCISALVCLGCCHEIPQTEWLEQQTYFSQFWVLESPRSGHWPIQYLGRVHFLICLLAALLLLFLSSSSL